jgi:hypothetical protein
VSLSTQDYTCTCNFSFFNSRNLYHSTRNSQTALLLYSCSCTHSSLQPPLCHSPLPNPLFSTLHSPLSTLHSLISLALPPLSLLPLSLSLIFPLSPLLPFFSLFFTLPGGQFFCTVLQNLNWVAGQPFSQSPVVLGPLLSITRCTAKYRFDHRSVV